MLITQNALMAFGLMVDVIRWGFISNVVPEFVVASPGEDIIWMSRWLVGAGIVETEI